MQNLGIRWQQLIDIFQDRRGHEASRGHRYQIRATDCHFAEIPLASTSLQGGGWMKIVQSFCFSNQDVVKKLQPQEFDPKVRASLDLEIIVLIDIKEI